jgi:hypothetical protein
MSAARAIDGKGEGEGRGERREEEREAEEMAGCVLKPRETVEGRAGLLGH